MDEQGVRRSIRRAVEPGPGFPDPALLDRTMARLGEERSSSGQLHWLAAAVTVAMTVSIVGALMVTRLGALSARQPADIPTQAGWTGPTSETRIGGADVRFVTASTGWLLERQLDGTARVFRTVDGGAHWTPAGQVSGLSDTLQAAAAHFFDANRAVIVIGSSAGHPRPLRVYSTTDGGAHWQRADAPDSLRYLWGADFVSPMEGWALAASSIGGASDIYHTTDAGRHWTLLGQPYRRASGPMPAILGTGSSLLQFANSQDGWVFDRAGPSSSGGLSTTHDGGRTWQPLRLPAAPGAGVPYQLQLPQLFGNEGVLVASSGGKEVLYVSHDAGRTWSFARALTPPMPTEAVVFTDPIHAFVVSGSPGSPGPPSTSTTLVSRTADGGRTWSVPVPIPVPDGWYVRGIDAVSFLGSSGWAIVQRSLPYPSPTPCATSSCPGPLATPSEPEYSVARTTDGGQHWTPGQLPAR
jgi:photosystem II stability/assembly factor-like uncharacterized protein